MTYLSMVSVKEFMETSLLRILIASILKSGGDENQVRPCIVHRLDFWESLSRKFNFSDGCDSNTAIMISE